MNIFLSEFAEEVVRVERLSKDIEDTIAKSGTSIPLIDILHSCAQVMARYIERCVEESEKQKMVSLASNLVERHFMWENIFNSQDNEQNNI